MNLALILVTLVISQDGMEIQMYISDIMTQQHLMQQIGIYQLNLLKKVKHLNFI